MSSPPFPTPPAPPHPAGTLLPGLPGLLVLLFLLAPAVPPAMASESASATPATIADALPAATESVGAAAAAAAPALAAMPAGSPAGPGLVASAAALWQHATHLDTYREAGYWRVAFAPAAPHFRPSAEHRHVVAIAVERQRLDHWLAGFSLFRNSFGQPSGYLYLGRRHERLLDVQPLFFQWSAGVLYGYRGEYKNKVALNVNGFAPGALVGLGWHFNRRSSAIVHLLGDAALMLQVSYELR